MKRLTVRFPTDVKTRLNAVSTVSGTSMSSLVRDAIASRIDTLERIYAPEDNASSQPIQ